MGRYLVAFSSPFGVQQEAGVDRGVSLVSDLGDQVLILACASPKTKAPAESTT